MTIPFHLQSVKNTYNMSVCTGHKALVSAHALCARQCDRVLQLQKARPEVERLAAQLKQEQEVRLGA